ncbi:hypothetical protein Tco_1311430 [Tanacetum coccineum]
MEKTPKGKLVVESGAKTCVCEAKVADFEDFTRCEPSAYRRDLLENLDTLEAVIHRAIITYGRLQLQSQDVQINPVQAVDDSLILDESAAAKPHQVNAPNYSRNSHKESYGSNDMVHAYFLEEARKMTQNKTRIPSHKDMASTRYTALLMLVNSRAKVQSPKIRNNNPVEPKNHTHKPGRRNGIGQRFSLNKSSAVHEKPHTPRSISRWKPTGRIFKTVSLRWIPTGKVFIDSTTKVDSEPPNGSNDDITNPYECNQTLYVSAGTSNSSAGTSVNPLKERLQSWLPKKTISHTSEFQGIQISFKPRSSSNDVWTKQFKPRSSSNVVWTKQFKPRSSSKDVWTKQFRPPFKLDEKWFTLSADLFWKALEITPADNSIPKTDLALALELCLDQTLSPCKKALQLDQTRVGQQREEDSNLPLLGQLSLLRMWEEFTQSIHTFTEDKRKLAQHTLGKKKATLILIPSIRFTKLIIFHLQRLHNFHPRPDSPLHLPTEEPVLGHLKFSAKGSKREVFGMTIPNELINNVIRGADYYDAYLEKVAKHQRYIAGEELSDPESPAPKPAKPTKQAKPKATEQPTVSKSKAKTSKPAPAKPKEKKRKPVSEPSETQPLPKRAKAGKVTKKRTVKSSKQLVDEFVDEGVPAAKPSLEDTEEAILQKVLEESLTDAYPTQRGPLPPVVFRETDTGKFQPLPEVPGKGKEKVGEEQAAQVLLNLQTPKKKSSAEQYILQRRSHIPTATAGREDSTSLYAELGLYGSDTESDEEMPSVGRSGTQDEGQAGSDPGTPDEGQAGPNPDDVAESLPLPTPSVLAGPNLEHSDVEITDRSNQPQPEHMDEGFTAAAYPDVQENLKLTVDEQVIPEEPVSSTGTLSSLQHLAKDFSFGDQFLNDKPSEADNEKTTADTEAESMVSVTIQQDISVIPPMTSPVIDLVSRPDSPNVHWPLPTTTTTTAAPPPTTTTTTLPLPPQPQQGPTDPILIKRIGELEEFIATLVEENQALETRLTKQGSRINKLESVDDLPTSDLKEIRSNACWRGTMHRGHVKHRVAYEALQGSIRRDECEGFDDDKAQEETKKKGKPDSPKPPPGSPPSPPPPPLPPSGASGASGTTGASNYAQAPPPLPPSSSTHQGDQSTGTAAPSSSKTAASAEYSAWTTTDTRVKPSITLIPDDLYMDDEITADEQAVSSDDEVGRDHIPTVNLRQSWWKPLTEDRPATPEPAWTIPSSDLSMPTNNWASALKSTHAPP